MVDQTGWPTRLWSLDEADSALPVVGVGMDGRFALINKLIRDVPPDHMVIVADDDVVFQPGALNTFAALVDRFNLDLAGPAHAWRGSYYFHRITLRHPWRIARLTTFVEAGPVLAISSSARTDFLPFPEEGMGWGAELLWYDRWKSGRRLGIVDCTAVRHIVPIGLSYDTDPERKRIAEMFAERGIEEWTDVQHNLMSFYTLRGSGHRDEAR